MTAREVRRVWLLFFLVAISSACSLRRPSIIEDVEASATGRGTLRHAHNLTVSTFDPHKEQRNVSLQYLMPVYETLVLESADGSEFEPLLALAWEETQDDLTFTLRQGVTFHDGQPFDADAVVANFDRVKTQGHAVLRGYLINVESVEALDSYTVRFNFSQYDPTVLYTLSRFAGMQVSPAAFERIGEIPIGTGAYQLNLEQTSSDKNRLVFDAYPAYWDPDIQTIAQYVHINMPDDGARTNAILAGDVDTSAIGGGPSVRQSLEQQGLQVLEAQTTGWALMIMDADGEMVPELADERVRLAIAYAIDREAYFQTADIGFATAQRSMSNMYGHSDQLAVEHDLERAKALMRAAGTTGFSLKMPTSPLVRRRVAPIVSMLAEIGIAVELELLEGIYTQQACSAFNYAMAVCPVNEGHIKHFVENRLLPTGVFNPAQHSDPEIQALYEQARLLPSEAAEPLYAEISRLATERGYVIMIGWSSTSVVINPERVSGVEMRFLMPAAYALRGVVVKE